MTPLRSDRIREILAKKHMSQNCFASRVDVSSSYMSMLMTGVRNPSPVLRRRILKALKIDISRSDEIFEMKG